MSRKEIMEDAKYSRFDPVTGLKWIWYGGHGVHGYDLSPHDPVEVDIINVGDFSRDEATLSEVENGVQNRIEDDRREYYNSITPHPSNHVLFVEEQLRRESSHEKCLPGKHWVSGYPKIAKRYGDANWVSGHCAKDPKGRR